MTPAQFQAGVESRNFRRMDLLLHKGQSYGGHLDAFANFKRNAEKLGLTKYQIWAVYCGKHLDSIFNSIKDNPGCPVEKTESLQGRIDDAINYLELLAGMLEEDNPPL